MLFRAASLIAFLSISSVYVTANKKVVGFFQSALSHEFSVNDINPGIYTHIKYAFVDIDAATSSCVVRFPDIDTDKIFPSDDKGCDCCARGAFNQLFNLKKDHPHLSTMLAIGGWTWSKNFSAVAATPETRTTFVESCMGIMLDYGFDGIDIDWEFPGHPSRNIGAPGIIQRDDDTDNMIALMAEFRRFMEKEYLLTLDVAPIPWYLNGDQTKRLASILDWFNVMSYEYALNGKSTTRHSSQLHVNPNDPAKAANAQEVLTFENAATWYLRNGATADQIVMGVPAYGRKYTGVSGGSNGLYGQIRGKRDEVVKYSEVLDAISSGQLTYHYDDIAQAAYASSADGTFVTFEDVRSTKAKAEYVNEHALGGLMLWSMDKDRDGDLSLAKAAIDTLDDVDTSKKSPIPQEPRSKFCNIKRAKEFAASSPKKDGKSESSDAVPRTIPLSGITVFALLTSLLL